MRPVPAAPVPAALVSAALVSAALMLAAPALPAAAQSADDIEQVGPWRLICYRGATLYGHAFESCRAQATIADIGIFMDRNSKGILGYLGGKRCPGASAVFRFDAKALAKPAKRTANLVKTINKTVQRCGQPPLAIDPASLEAVLAKSDGLSPDWVE